MPKVDFTDFSAGWTPDIAESEIGLNAANRLNNAYTRNLSMTGLYGLADYLPAGLPAGLTIKKVGQFQFTFPSTKKVYLVHGTMSGLDRLYAYPYLSSAGAWIDAWLELTEAETSLAMDGDQTAGTNRFIKCAGLASATDDYYNGWVFLNEQTGYTSYVKDYVGSTKTLEIYNDSNNGPAYAFSVWRNPIYAVKGTGAPLAKVRMFTVPSEIEFVYHENSVKILCGHENVYDRGPDVNDNLVQSDFELIVLSGDKKFNAAAEFSFTGFYLTRKHISPLPHKTNTADAIISVSAVASSDDPLATAVYAFFLAAKYDGVHESPIFVGTVAPYDGTRYSYAGGDVYIAFFDGAKLARLTITMYTRKFTDSPNFHDVAGFTYKNKAKSVFYHDEPLFSRRITHLAVYAVQMRGSVPTSYVTPISSFLKVLEIDINDPAWTASGSSANGWYTITKDVLGSDWTGAQGKTNLIVQGHVSANVFGNAKFGGVSSDVFVYAGVRQESLRADALVFTPTPTQSSAVNQSDILPSAFSSLFLDAYGISEIVACVFTESRVIAFGSDKAVVVNPETQGVEKVFYERGPVSRNAALEKNGLVYFAAEEDIYLLHPTQLIIRSIAMAQLRDYWRTSVSSVDKAGTAMSYDRFNEMLIISAGSTILLYSLPRVYASAEVGDLQAYGTWGKYVVSKEFLNLFTDISGKAVGVTEDNLVKRLFETESINAVFRSKVFEGSFLLESAVIEYTSPSSVTLKVFDLAKSTLYPRRKYVFPKATKFQGNRLSFRDAQIERMMFELTFPSGAVINRFSVNVENIGLE